MPGRLPQLPGASPLVDDELPSPIQQINAMYKPKDARKIQQLDPVFTLGDLRRSGIIGLRDTIRSSLAYPGLSPNFLNEPLDGVLSDPDDDDGDPGGGSSSGDDGDGGDGGGSAARLSAGASTAARNRTGGRVSSPEAADPQPYNATAAARAALLHEKPAVVERMEKGVAACAVLRDNRHFRLNSLGVFQPGVNDVRARSMHRVELHKHLSTVNLRAPQPDKEVRSALQTDSVGVRLERMYNRVLRTGPGAAGGGGGGGGTGGGGGGGGTGMLSGTGGLGGGGAGMGGGGMGEEGPATGTGQWGGGGGMGVTVSSLPTGTLERGGGGGTARQLGHGSAGGGRAGPGASAGGGNTARRLAFGSAGGAGGGHTEGRSGPPSLGLGAGPGPGSETHHRHASPRTRVAVHPASAHARIGPSSAEPLASSSASATASPGRPALLSISSFGRHGSPGAGNGTGSGRASGSGMLGPHSPHSPPHTVNGGGGTSSGGAQAPSPPPLQGLSPSSPAPAGREREREREREGGQGGAHNSRGTARSSDYWMRVTLPPEVIEAQLRHLAATTEAHLRTYHERVAAAQDALLADSGLGPAALAMPPEQVEQALKVKLGQIKEDSDTNYNYSSLSREAVLASRLGAASKALLTATSLPAFIRAALEHVGQHSGELAAIRAARRDRAAEDGKAGDPRSKRGRGDASGGSGEERSPSPPKQLQPAPTQRWRPPGMALLSGAQGQSAAAARAAAGSGPKRPEAEVSDEWLAAFREELRAIEASTPDCPPEGVLPLPALPSGDMDAGAYVRARLERLWGLLEMPPAVRLDMVLWFTARERALTFGTSLTLWEAAAAAVISREAQVEALVAVQREVESGQASRLSLGGVAALCGRVLRLTRWVACLSARLRADSGWVLTRGGAPYPGEDAIGAEHLLAFLGQLRSATEGTGLRL